MKQQAVLDYLTSALSRMRLSLRLLTPQQEMGQVDFGLRALLGLKEDYQQLKQVFFRWLKQRMVYKLMDPFGCHYIFFALPEDGADRTVLIGPYLTAEMTDASLLNQLERLGLPMQELRPLRDYYASLPVFQDVSMLLSLVSAMGETLWGSVDAFETVDLNQDVMAPLLPSAHGPATEAEQLEKEMKQIQIRYDYENQLIDTVAKGLIQRLEMVTGNLSQLHFEQRMADPLRNVKNYSIICNTLLRKAAEQGGVHPLYIDRMSSQYAIRIENQGTLNGCSALIGEMCRAYCRLVRTHAIRQYSVQVQKVLLYIEANLSGDLSLQTLAGVLSLTPGYLSDLFHRETGKTLTAHVTEQRMKHALHLLQTTHLQVQNVAQLCGIPDANYFTKRFKRQYGVTPRQYRDGLIHHAAKE